MAKLSLCKLIAAAIAMMASTIPGLGSAASSEALNTIVRSKTYSVGQLTLGDGQDWFLNACCAYPQLTFAGFTDSANVRYTWEWEFDFSAFEEFGAGTHVVSTVVLLGPSHDAGAPVLVMQEISTPRYGNFVAKPIFESSGFLNVEFISILCGASLEVTEGILSRNYPPCVPVQLHDGIVHKVLSPEINVADKALARVSNSRYRWYANIPFDAHPFSSAGSTLSNSSRKAHVIFFGEDGWAIGQLMTELPSHWSHGDNPIYGEIELSIEPADFIVLTMYSAAGG